MPNIETVNGVKINIYFIEHLPPHIHAEYNEHEELLEIETFAVYDGYLPSKQHKIAVNWLRANQAEARKTFFNFNPHLNAPRRKNTKNSKNKRS